MKKSIRQQIADDDNYFDHLVELNKNNNEMQLFRVKMKQWAINYKFN